MLFILIERLKVGNKKLKVILGSESELIYFCHSSQTDRCGSIALNSVFSFSCNIMCLSVSARARKKYFFNYSTV